MSLGKGVHEEEVALLEIFGLILDMHARLHVKCLNNDVNIDHTKKQV